MFSKGISAYIHCHIFLGVSPANVLLLNFHELKMSASSGIFVIGCHGREDVPFLPMGEMFVYQSGTVSILRV